MSPRPRAWREEVRRFDPEVPIERAWTPPSSWYTSPEVHELERRVVFARAWQPLARVVELAEPGAYATGCSAGEPWVAVRDATGDLAVLANTCRHKGREVAVGSGRADVLVCGYHAWTYDLRGRLASAPRMAGVEGFDRDALSLEPWSAETFGHWLFGNPDPCSPPLAERLPEVSRRLGETGWESLRFAATRSWTLDCNWKVYVDNYLDGGYHVPHMHPTLDAQIDMRTYRTETFEISSIQRAETASTGDARIAFEPSRRIGGGAIYAWIYPNFMINRYGTCLDTNLVVPLGPDRCQVLYEFFFTDPEEARASGFLEQSLEQSDVTQREDVAICESVQRGLRSLSYDRGRYAPRVEQGEHHFHRLLAKDLRRALEDS